MNNKQWFKGQVYSKLQASLCCTQSRFYTKLKTYTLSPSFSHTQVYVRSCVTIANEFEGENPDGSFFSAVETSCQGATLSASITSIFPLSTFELEFSLLYLGRILTYLLYDDEDISRGLLLICVLRLIVCYTFLTPVVQGSDKTL